MICIDSVKKQFTRISVLNSLKTYTNYESSLSSNVYTEQTSGFIFPSQIGIMKYK